MKEYIKGHLKELIWFSFLNKTQIFLSHELFEIFYICYKKEKVMIDENSLKLMLKKTIFNAVDKDDIGEIKWINENSKKYKTLIKKDILFLNGRSKKIVKKWFLISFKQLIKTTYEFYFEEEDIDLFEIIMEIDDEYKSMLLNCIRNKLSLDDEVYSILNIDTDQYIEDNILKERNYSSSISSRSSSGTISSTSNYWKEDWSMYDEIYINNNTPNTIDNSNAIKETDKKDEHIYDSVDINPKGLLEKFKSEILEKGLVTRNE